MDRPWIKHVVEGNPIEIEIPNISITQLLEKSIAQYPDHTAMTFFGKTFTYSELDESVKQVAVALAERGIQKNDRVAIMLPNCPQYPISYYAALMCGATIVQVNPMYKASELIHILNDSEVKLLIVMDKLLPLFESIRGKTSVREVIPIVIESAFLPEELTPSSGGSIT